MLGLVGQSLSVKKHIDAILEVLPPKYETFIVSVNTRTDPYTVEEIESLLMAKEVRFEKQVKTVELATANLAQSGFHTNPGKKRFFNPQGGGNSRGGYFGYSSGASSYNGHTMG